MNLKLPLYVYRRKGQPSFVVCDKARFDDLSQHSHLFETQVVGEDIPDNKELLRLLALAWGTGDVSAADCRKIDALIAGQALPDDKYEGEKGSGSLEFDGLLAAFHAIVWATAESDDPGMAYDEAGNKEAKQLQAMYRAAVEGRKA